MEDRATGLSVSIPSGMDWEIYVEVPTHIHVENPKESLDQFIRDVPALGILGEPHLVDHSVPYTVDDDVQLVCKYLKAYWDYKDNKGRGINRLYRDKGAIDSHPSPLKH